MSAHSIVSLCWIIFVVYWAINAGFAKPTQEKVGGIGGIWHGFFIALAYLIMVNDTTPIINTILFPDSTFISFFAALLAVVGLIIAIIARNTLARNWSGNVTFKKDHELITHGVYGYMRHPIYTAVLLMFLGSSLTIRTTGAFIGFLIIITTLWFKLRQEEALMTKHFPKAYPPYMKKVKALIPYIL